MSLLNKIALRQYGYFTAKQAQEAGYVNANHAYHVRVGNWLHIDWGLFRLPGYEDSFDADLMRWVLWTRGKSGRAQGVVSHCTALEYYRLLPLNRFSIQLTVPPEFRKRPPQGISLYREDLTPADLRPGPAFGVVAPVRALLQTQIELPVETREALLIEMLGRGLVTEEELAQAGLKAELERAAAGFAQVLRRPIPTSEVVSADGPAETSPRGEEQDMPKQAIAATVADRPAPAEPATGPAVADIPARTFFRARPYTERLSRRRGEAAFTLVELLVVVAIISALAGMLLPALEKALETARRAACAGNQRQIGFAAFAYAGDFADCMPGAGYSHMFGGHFQGREDKVWLEDYFDYRTYNFNERYYSIVGANNAPITKHIFKCPDRANYSYDGANRPGHWDSASPQYARCGFSPWTGGGTVESRRIAYFCRLSVMGRANVTIAQDLAHVDYTPGPWDVDYINRMNNHSRGYPSSSPEFVNALDGTGAVHGLPCTPYPPAGDNSLGQISRVSGTCGLWRKSYLFGFIWYSDDATLIKFLEPDGTVGNRGPDYIRGKMW